MNTAGAQVCGFLSGLGLSGAVSLQVFSLLLLGPGSSMLYALHAFIVPYLTARKAKVIAGPLLGTMMGMSTTEILLADLVLTTLFMAVGSM